MYGGEAPTSFDLRFRLFGFPVRVSPMFWLISALFGSSIALQIGLQYLLLWVACMFFSILLHELGHAIAFRVFGSPSEIVLHGFGGAAQGYRLNRPWKRMLVALAGPAIQLGFAVAVYAGEIAFRLSAIHPVLAVAVNFLLWMNFVWALINLVPLLPLDGGVVLREVLEMLRVRNPDAVAHGISVAMCALLALRGIAALGNFRLPGIDDVLPTWLVPGHIFTFWLILLGVENFQMMQRYGRRGPQSGYARPNAYDDDTPPWRRR